MAVAKVVTKEELQEVAELKARGHTWEEIGLLMKVRNAFDRYARDKARWADAYLPILESVLCSEAVPEAFQCQRELMKKRESGDIWERRLAQSAAHSILIAHAKLSRQRIEVTGRLEKEQATDDQIVRMREELDGLALSAGGDGEPAVEVGTAGAGESG